MKKSKYKGIKRKKCKENKRNEIILRSFFILFIFIINGLGIFDIYVILQLFKSNEMSNIMQLSS